MRTVKVRLSLLCGIALCALLLATSPTRANAQMPGPHPSYLHAITDLRQARSLLSVRFANPAHAQAAAAATHEINDAIRDLKQASYSDGKDLGQDPPPDASMLPDGRFHHIYGFLQQAHKDASGQESDPNAVTSRNNAVKHIENALQMIGAIVK